jgi:hypothetical protein
MKNLKEHNTMVLLQWSNKEKIAKLLLEDLTSTTEHLYIKIYIMQCQTGIQLFLPANHFTFLCLEPPQQYRIRLQADV